MLSELHIRNFAIIDELHMQFDSRFNVVTGETGAGKSIILDAVTLVLGGRADTTMIRTGRSEAYVEATFELNSPIQELLAPLLLQEGLDNDPAHLIILARELRTNGRSISRVNGRNVNLGLLRQVAEPLIDIHGQGEHLSLLRPNAHLPLLDDYAGLESERAVVASAVGSLGAVRRELSALRRDERLLAQKLDMLQFQVKEIDAANLQDGEEAELRQERVRLANAEQLTRFAGEAVNIMNGVEDGETESVADRLGQVERLLTQLVRYDASQAARLENLQGLVFQFSEIAADLQNYLDELEFNPDRLNHIEERLELINSLKRKYGDDIAAILQFRENAEAELEQISSSEARITELEKEQEHHLQQIGKLALALSQKRRVAAQKLAEVVEQQLADLKMVGTRFEVEFTYQPQAEGAYVKSGNEVWRYAFDKTGIDQVQFLISANPGEPLKPMAKVASGGETSRLMLALKTALSQVDSAPTLIFDEIDQGIGGRIGDVAGQKLWDLTSSARHQVIVVTHLPQLAGYGDSHFRVSKHISGGRTTTDVDLLDKPGRIQELAAMLGALGEHAQGGAESILRRVTAVKNGSP
jgi:DNA repair protein RecN (Recombination protein N)